MHSKLLFWSWRSILVYTEHCKRNFFLWKMLRNSLRIYLMKFVPQVIGKKMLFWIIKLLSLWNMKDFGYWFIESWQNNLRERTGEYHLDYIELYAMLYIFYAILVITWTSHAKECLGNMSFIFHTFHKSQIPCKKMNILDANC